MAKLNECRNLFELAAEVLIEAGVTDVDLAYKFFSGLPGRTVRRIFEEASSLSTSELEKRGVTPREKTCTLGTSEMDAISTLAKSAGVRAHKALSAVLRFGNPMERVMGVLTDLRALVASGGRVNCPEGLFVSLMRTGGSLVLPDRVLAAREGEEARKAQEAQAEQRRQEVQARASEAALDAQAALDATAEAGPEQQWAVHAATLRLSLRWPAAELARLERACRAGVLRAADLAREAAAARAGGGLTGWAEGLRMRLV